jgi:hypothetical protein
MAHGVGLRGTQKSPIVLSENFPSFEREFERPPENDRAFMGRRITH